MFSLVCSSLVMIIHINMITPLLNSARCPGMHIHAMCEVPRDAFVGYTVYASPATSRAQTHACAKDGSACMNFRCTTDTCTLSWQRGLYLCTRIVYDVCAHGNVMLICPC